MMLELLVESSFIIEENDRDQDGRLCYCLATSIAAPWAIRLQVVTRLGQ